MALTTYLLRKTHNNGQTAIDHCYNMLHTIDPLVSTTPAARLAAGTELARVALGVDHLPANYFDVPESVVGVAAGGLLPLLGNSLVIVRGGEILTV